MSFTGSQSSTSKSSAGCPGLFSSLTGDSNCSTFATAFLGVANSAASALCCALGTVMRNYGRIVCCLSQYFVGVIRHSTRARGALSVHRQLYQPLYYVMASLTATFIGVKQCNDSLGTIQLPCTFPSPAFSCPAGYVLSAVGIHPCKHLQNLPVAFLVCCSVGVWVYNLFYTPCRSSPGHTVEGIQA